MKRILTNILVIGLMVYSGAIMHPAAAPVRALLSRVGMIMTDEQRAVQLMGEHDGDVQKAFFGAIETGGGTGILESLIARGAKVDAVNSDHVTALCWVMLGFAVRDRFEQRDVLAVWWGLDYDYEGLYNFLVSAGADIEKLYTLKLRGTDRTVLDVAIDNDSYRFVRKLIVELRKRLAWTYRSRKCVSLSNEELTGSLGIWSTLNQDVIGRCIVSDLSVKDLASLACASKGCKQLVYGIMNETFPRCKREELNAVIDLALQRANVKNSEEVVALLEQEKDLGFEYGSDFLTMTRRRMVRAVPTLSLLISSDSDLLTRGQRITLLEPIVRMSLAAVYCVVLLEMMRWSRN